jgi:hypothetical protein
MFDTYDSYEKKYRITYTSTGRTNELTTQELYEFYIFNTHNIYDSFEDVLKRLDAGDTVLGDDNEFDFTIGTEVYNGQLKITKSIPKGLKMNTLPPPVPNSCDHRDKYINSAGGVRFYVCPKCKRDLGDAK